MIRNIVFVLFFILMSSKVYCCDCSGKPSIEKNWELASEVFVGEIVKIDSLLYGSYGQKVYVFSVKIKKSYKGDFFPGYEFRDLLATDSGSCDFFFDIGKEYLIYAKNNSYALYSSICSRTDLLKNIDSTELVLLDKLNKDFLNDKKVKISRFQDNIEYQIELVKNSFEEKLKRKEIIIYGLSTLSFILFLIILLLGSKKAFKRNI